MRYLFLIPIAFMLLFTNLNTASAKQVEINQDDINKVIYTYMDQQYLSLKDSIVSDFSNVVQDKYLLDTVTAVTKYKVDFNSEISKRLLDYKLNISNIETNLTGKKVIVHILSTAALTYQKDKLEPYSFIEEREHIIILENFKGDWIITKDIYDELDSPDESFIDDSNYNKDMYESFVNNKISVKEKAKLSKKIQESITKTSTENTIVETDNPIISPMISTLDNTYLSKGIDYAHKWATSNNPNYKVYSNDCTNYVSQILKAAGFSTDSTWKPYTDAWIQVESLYDYLHSKGWASYVYSSGDEAGNASNKASEGDIIQFYNISKLRYSHSVYATKKVWRSSRGTYDILYCGHSNFKYDYSLIDAFEGGVYYSKLRVIKVPYGVLIA